MSGQVMSGQVMSGQVAGRPLALVYRGPAALPGCAEAVVSLLAESRHGFRVTTVGPDGHLPLDAETLAGAALYAQPGGGTLRQGWRRMRRHRRELRSWVDGGGRYLGFCLGAYLAGTGPGLGLLPGDTDRQRVAGVRPDEDAVVDVVWRGAPRRVFFQDGARLELDAAADAEVLARYRDGAVAAAVVPSGRGRVGVAGPHPEATRDWFADAGLPLDGLGPHLARDLAHDLVDTLVARAGTAR